MENHIWKKIGRQLDNEWRNLGDNWRPHLGERWKTTKQQKDSLSLSLSPSPSDLPARAVQRARWKHAHVALLQQPDWETTSRKPHLGDNWETTSGRQVEDNWETTSVRQLGDNWAASRIQLGDNWKTSGRQLEHNWKLWETTGRPLGDKVPMPRTLLEEPKIGGHSGRQGGRQTGRHSSGDKGDSGRHTVGDKGGTARDKVGDTVEDNCAHTCQREKKVAIPPPCFERSKPGPNLTVFCFGV